MALNKVLRRAKIKRRIRKKITGTAVTPRLTVFRSNKQIYAQLIDDASGKTLASAGSLKMTEAQKVANGQTKLYGQVTKSCKTYTSSCCWKNDCRKSFKSRN